MPVDKAKGSSAESEKIDLKRKFLAGR